MSKKKEKITYVDDGRTLADMSGVSGGSRRKRNPYTPRSTWRERWDTYKAAVRMMFMPMLVVICGILIVYMLMSFIFLLL